jgi:hypothetical protein
MTMATGPDRQIKFQSESALRLERNLKITHDINNALVILFSASEEMLHVMPPDHPWRKLADDVYSNARSVAHLIEQFSFLPPD